MRLASSVGALLARWVEAIEHRRVARVRARRDALLTCQHPDEHLLTGCTLEYRCLACGNVRHVGYVWFGNANNYKPRREA